MVQDTGSQNCSVNKLNYSALRAHHTPTMCALYPTAYVSHWLQFLSSCCHGETRYQRLNLNPMQGRGAFRKVKLNTVNTGLDTDSLDSFNP